MNANVLLASAHTVGESNLHLQFTPAYRRDVFESRVLRDIVTSLFIEQARKLRVTLAALDYGPDHVHLFITNWKRWGIADLAQRFKGTASRALRRDYAYLFEDKLWGDKFWTSGYFYRTVGVVTAETVRRYVAESQKKHWENHTWTPQQTLLAYA
jgi:putative transposase